MQLHGKRATVEPIAKYSKRGKLFYKLYLAEFRFRTENGNQIVLNRSFPESVLEELERGTPVEIMYLPSDPHTFVFASERGSWTLIVIGVIVILFSLVLQDGAAKLSRRAA
jgi:hypothetical protein